jgi:hypothetical protein
MSISREEYDMKFFWNVKTTNELIELLNTEDVFSVEEQHDGSWTVGYIDHG